MSKTNLVLAGLLALCVVVIGVQNFPRASKPKEAVETPETVPETVEEHPGLPPPPSAPRVVSTRSTHSETKRKVAAPRWRTESRRTIGNVDARDPVFQLSFYVHRNEYVPSTASLQRNLKVEPAVANLRVLPPDDGWSSLVYGLTGDFTTGQKYTVTMPKDAAWQTADGDVFELPEDFVFTGEVPKTTASLRLDMPGRYYVPQDRMLASVRTVNAKSYKVAASRLLPHNLVTAARREFRSSWEEANDWTKDLTAASTSLVYRVEMEEERVEKSWFSLKPFMDEKAPRGVYLVGAEVADEGDVEAWYWSRYWRRDINTRLIAITEIGLGALKNDGTLVVCALSLSGAEPLAGIEVEAYAVNGTVLANGVTDAQGLAELALPAGNANGAPFLVVASGKVRGVADQSFLLLNDRNQAGIAPVSTHDYLKENLCEVFLFTERGIYRPGDTVFVQGLIRGHETVPPLKKFPVFLKLVTPADDVAETVTVTFDEHGAFSHEFKLPESGRQGTYRIVAAHAPDAKARVMGSVSVAMESFVPPAIRVSLGDMARTGDGLSFPVRSEFLFGAPAAGLPLKAQVRVTESPFAPEGWSGFIFGNVLGAARRDKSEKFPETELDESGAARITVPHPGRSERGALALHVTAEVIEPGGRPVAQYKKFQFNECHEAYLGFKKNSGAVPGGSGIPLELVVVAADGQAVPEEARADWRYSTEILQTHEYWVMRKNDDGWWQWTLAEEKTSVQKQDGLAELPTELPALPPGRYTLVVAREDGASCCAVSVPWSVADGNEPADRGSPEKLAVSAAKEIYAPGETAEFEIRVPFEGARTVFVAVCNDGLVAHHTLPVDGTVARFELPLTEAHLPGVSLLASAVHPARTETRWGSHRALGSMFLPVAPADSRLSVVLDAADTSLPSRDYPVSVTITDADGEPVADAGVVVMMVEEGICRLTDFKTPDPHGFFFGPRRLAFSFFDMYRNLIPLADEANAVEASLMGGDDDALDKQLRRRLNPITARRFNPLVRWVADLTTDEAGRVDTRIPLHEVNTGARLMAVAWSGNRYGSAAREVQIRRDVTVLFDAPRFLVPGDTAEGTITLFNTTDKLQAAALQLTATGCVTTLPPPRVVELPPGASSNVTYRMSADQGVGVATLSLDIIPAGEPAYTSSFELPVRPVCGLQSTVEYTTIKPGETATFPAPGADTFMPGSLTRTLYAYGNPLNTLKGALAWLENYPYGCAEQTASQTFPLLGLRKTLHGPERDAADARIRFGINRLLSMWRGDGFSLWSQYNITDSYVSAYVLDLLVAARAEGFTIPDAIIEQAIKGTARRCDNASTAQNVYACYVLAATGAPEHGTMMRCRELRANLPAESRVLLAAAFLEAGNAVIARELLNEIPFPAADVPAAAHMLMLRCKLDPAAFETTRLANTLRQHLRPSGHWGTTRDNGLAVRALGAYYAAMAPEPGDFNLALTSVRGTDHSGATNRFEFVIERDASSLTLRNTGAGTAFLAVKTDAIPLGGLPPDEDRGGIALRRTSDAENRELKRRDIVTSTLTLDTRNIRIENLVIDVPLPSGLEPYATPEWISDNGTASSIRSHVYQYEQRDDRFLFFLKPIRGTATIRYQTMAVSVGSFIKPPATASDMYDPDCLSTTGGGRVSVGAE